MAPLKSVWTGAVSASEQEQNNVDVAQQQEPLLTGELEQANDLTGGGIELQHDAPDDQDELKKLKGSKSRDMVDYLKSVWTGAVSASEQEQNNVDVAQQQEPLLTGELEQANDLTGGGIELQHDAPDDQDELKKLKGSKSRDMVDYLKSVWTGAVSASAREQNNVDMAQQREPLLTGEFERANDLTAAGIERPRDTPDDQDELKKLKGLKSRDMVDDLKSGLTGAVSASAREQNNVEMAQQQEPLLTGEFERANDLTAAGIERLRDTPDDQDELKKLKGLKSRDMVDDFKSGLTGAVSASAREQNNVEMAQQQEPLLTGEFERANDLTAAGIERLRDTPDDQDELKKLKGLKSRDMVDDFKSGLTGAVSASAREQNNAEMAQQQEPLLTGEFERANDLTAAGIERLRDTPDDQDELKKLKGLKSRDMVDDFKSGLTGAVSASAREQNNAEMAQQQEPLLTGEFERANDLTAAGIERLRDTPDDQDELKKLKGLKSRDMVDDFKSGLTSAVSASAREQNNVEMAQQQEPLLTGEFERENDLTATGIERPPDTPDDQDELKKLKGLKSRDMVDDFKSGLTGAVSASAQQQNNVEMAQQQEPLLTGEFELENDLNGGGIERPRDTPDELKKLKGSKYRDMVDFLKSGWTLLLTNLILEMASAVFDQLGYALVGMVLAFVALLLSTAELIYMARKERMMALVLPISHRPSTTTLAPGKPVGTIVEYFGWTKEPTVTVVDRNETTIHDSMASPSPCTRYP
ncbi:hypothetical protein OIU76_024165 [Salix suchowensis]|nr:hypothetical protein OIU76_024165 [Salix suchowensis]